MKYIHPKRYYRKFLTTIKNFYLHYLLTDRKYLELRYFEVFGKKLDLENPMTFNEKLQWLKLYDRKEIYHTMVDKVKAKKLVAKRIGEQYIIPTLGVWDSFDDINFIELPNQFVIKCNHDAQSTIICTDKSCFDYKMARKKIQSALKQDYYRYTNRQWAYKDIKPCVLAEKFMTDSHEIELGLTDYKFFCFNGRVDCVMIAIDREIGLPKFYFFNKNWDLLKYNYSGINAAINFTLPRPTKLEEMFEIAAKLSKDIPFVRVDLYLSNNAIYFGELTFYPDGGVDKGLLPEIDILFGQMINLNH